MKSGCGTSYRPAKDPNSNAMVIIAPVKRGRPPKLDPATIIPSTVVSVRIPTALYDAFWQRARRLGFRNISEPLKRFIQREVQQNHAQRETKP